MSLAQSGQIKKESSRLPMIKQTKQTHPQTSPKKDLQSTSSPSSTTTSFSTMKCLRQFLLTHRAPSSSSSFSFSLTSQRQRHLSTSAPHPATVQPITASGPPPKVPVPSAEHVDSRVARRRKQAELLKRGQDLRDIAGGKGGGTAKSKRFWKHVHVREVYG